MNSKLQIENSKLQNGIVNFKTRIVYFKKRITNKTIHVKNTNKSYAKYLLKFNIHHIDCICYIIEYLCCEIRAHSTCYGTHTLFHQLL